MGGVGLFSGKKCTVGRLVANPWASQQYDGGRVVEIGGIDSLGVQQEVSYGLLLNLFPNLPADAERRPLKRHESFSLLGSRSRSRRTP